MLTKSTYIVGKNGAKDECSRYGNAQTDERSNEGRWDEEQTCMKKRGRGVANG